MEKEQEDEVRSKQSPEHIKEEGGLYSESLGGFKQAMAFKLKSLRRAGTKARRAGITLIL